MKKSIDHTNEIASLREVLTPLDNQCPLPGALEANRVLQNATTPRRSYAPYLRRGLALAAAMAVVITTVVLVDRLNFFTEPDLDMPLGPTTIATGEQTNGPNTLVPSDPSALTTTAAEKKADFGTSYAELQKAFLQMQEERRGRYAYDYDMTVEEARTEPAAEFAVPNDAAAPPAEPGQIFDRVLYSASTVKLAETTNTQVQGVDEADILKNDGEYLYYLQGNKLRIMKAQPALEVLSTLTIPSYRQDTQIYLIGDRMALVYSEYPPGGDPASSVQVYNIKDRGNPQLVKSFSQPGSLLSSRMINGRVYLISLQWANLDFVARNGVIAPEDILPVVYNNGRARTLPADCIAIMPETQEPSYLMVSSLDVNSNRSESESAAILGAGNQMYCSRTALFVACQQWQGMDGLMRTWGAPAKTLIYKFDLLSDGKIKAAGSGEAPGAPLNQFSMDEYKGYFRIATTGNRNTDGQTINFITILDSNLKQVGAVEDIAPGERIQSARFLGGKGYIVTFRQTDPLFVIDLENPRAPKILGELKIPGFSAYLHPWDATHLIGIGPGGDDRGTDGSTKVSLFDISDPARPREIDKAVIPNTWCDIQQNHKILTVCAERGLLGLPLSGSNGQAAFYTFQVEGDQVNRSWTLDPAKSSNAREISPYYGYYEPGYTMRGTFIDGTWYVLGAQGVAAYAMESGKAAGTVLF